MAHTPDETPAYIARAACGCIVMAVVDNPRHARQVSREVADAIKDGLTVERVTVQYVRDNWRTCPHKAPAAEQLSLMEPRA